MAEWAEYITRDGDRWDLVAWRAYGDVTKMSDIIADNPHVPVLNVLPAGLRLLVRVVEDEVLDDGQDLPPWKREA